MQALNLCSEELNLVKANYKMMASTSLAALLFVTSATGVFAQQADDSSDGEGGKNSLTIEEIIVTAQKREQSYLEVPLSVSAISEDILERQNIDSLADYAIRVPGLTYSQAGLIGYRGGESITLRGVSGRANYYLDETPLPITDVRLFDVTRIEVLRGPQGTLYGDSAMGGTVKIITNKPSVDDISAGFSSGYSFTEEGDNSFFSEGFINLPVNDKIAFRLTGYYEEVGGFIDNIPPTSGLGDQSGGFLPFDVNVQKDVNGGHRAGARAALRYLASENLTIDLSGWFQEIRLGARSFFDEGTPLQTAMRGKMFEEQDFKYYSATVTWNSDDFNIISSNTFYDIDTINTEDLTNFLAAGQLGIDPGVLSNPQQLNNAFPAEAFSHETRISFERELSGMQMYAIAGVFYQNRKSSRNQYWFDSQSIADINSAGVFPFDFGFLFDLSGVERGLWAFQEIPQETNQLAFFGEITIEPVAGVEITAGLRYFEFDVTQTRTVDGFIFSGFEESSGKTSDNGINPRFGVKVDVADDVIAFANVAKGFNIGTALGSALPSICDAQLQLLGLDDGPVDPESLWNYEAGLKGNFLGGRLTVEGGGYYIEWSDIQESIVLDTNQCPERLLGNFGNATIYGGELSFTALPAKGLRVSGSVGYTDVDRSRPAIGANAAEQVGNRLITTSIQVQYSFPLTADLGGYIGGDYQYIEEGRINEPGTPHYNVVNARLGVTSEENWEVVLVGRNVFNVRPPLISFAPGTIGNLAPQIGTIRPRTIGAEVRVRF